MRDVDLPGVVAELAAEFDRYEQALRNSDLEVLAQCFADGDEVVRFGIADRQQGAEELARWRAAQPPLPPGRTLTRTIVTTYGTDVGIVTTEFSYPGRDTLGRQSQTWIREDRRWRIVHAHVSEIAPVPARQ